MKNNDKEYHELVHLVYHSSMNKIIKFINKNSNNEYFTLDDNEVEEMCLNIVERKSGYEFLKIYSELDLNGCFKDNGDFYDELNTRGIACNLLIDNIKDLSKIDTSDLYSVDFEII